MCGRRMELVRNESLRTDRNHTLDESLSQPAGRPGRFANAAAGAGQRANSLRLSSADRITAAGRSRSQCEAGFYRLYREEGLQVRTAKRSKTRRTCARATGRSDAAEPALEYGFCVDRLGDGRWFRILTVVDQYTRECLCAYADRSQTGTQVVAQMKRLVAVRGVPESITTDNGSEFAGRVMEVWALAMGVKLDFIRPGRPVQNRYIESFHGRLRDECLNGEVFFNLTDAREKIERWRDDYNRTRPHSALGDRTPQEFAAVTGGPPFALPMVNKASALPCQGSAGASGPGARP